MRIAYDKRIWCADYFIDTGLNVCVLVRSQLILYLGLEQRANELVNKRHG